MRRIFFREGLNREDWLPASAVTHKICLSLLLSEAGRDGEGEQTNVHPFIPSSLHLDALCNINMSEIGDFLHPYSEHDYCCLFPFPIPLDIITFLFFSIHSSKAF